jgi:hypothetical protein
MCGINSVQASYLGTASAFEVGMLMSVRFYVGTETPYPIITCDLMHQTLFAEPFKHPVERNPVQL